MAAPLMRGHTAFLSFAVAGLVYRELPAGEEPLLAAEVDKTDSIEEVEENEEQETTES